MNAKTRDLFQTVCFLAIMQHGKGLISKHPTYIIEKKKTIESPLAAWKMLDGEGQRKIWDWATKFGFPLEECICEISQEVFPQ